MAVPVRDTMMDVVVEEDCNKTVARMPTIRPAMGLVSSPNNSPALQPVMTLAPVPRSSKANRKK